jgi:hypothetical protein
MELRKNVKRKTETLVRRKLIREFAYYLETAPYVPPLADYYEAAEKEGLSLPGRDTLRMNACQAAIPALKACFDELMKDWESRMGREKPDLGTDRIGAVKTAALILFLTDI